MSTTLLDPAALGPWGWSAAALLGLIVGSFLNVVIHRLPRMLERRWAAECAALQAPQSGAPPLPSESSRFDLLYPASHCPACKTPIRWYHNIPVLGWLLLRGRCAACGAPIAWRYPLVEVLTGVAFAIVFARHGAAWPTLAWWGFAAAVLALAFIDWDTTLLPDDITLPLAWAGLIAAALGWSGVTLADALWGAVAGYLSLWSVYWAFKLLTGKEGMGYGDFKLLAGLGAWLGWQALIPIVLVASALGAVVGLAMKAMQTLREGRYVPFGPFLAFGGLLVWALGPRQVLGVLGL
ncbi:A24 family peptidase [Tepidimonas taiwanensis]|uniref:Prepilin leader peptidase/N-methyltransferase n=1 Tax=Tepidimonas taiwanensis TaxID=307486 RepID=A0A554XAT7_9BURK|nr:A24 family peptidase [Tepidimonas taiwanensis]MCX7693189.1 A24 family peptidase [Tepidimonas taiwanensis]TSE32951.1 Type 4 prepilin-like protein leader peptide-processing enzyme [Tepidimonas taiwanensis]UBQ04515.1 A24 family peptidase [Tepidimonas taiwanensis]